MHIWEIRVGGLANVEGKQKPGDGKQWVGSMVTNHDTYNLAGIVNNSGQTFRQVTTVISNNQIQYKTSSGKNIPHLKNNDNNANYVVFASDTWSLVLWTFFK